MPRNLVPLMTNLIAETDARPIPVHIVTEDTLPGVLTELSEPQKSWVALNDFKPSLGTILLLPGPDGSISGVLFGWGTAQTRARGRFHLAKLVRNLPEGDYQIVGELSAAEAREHALGWALAGYGFDRFKTVSTVKARLVAPPNIDPKSISAIARAEFLARDLINTPANLMGPDALEAAFADLGKRFGAEVSVIKGKDLLEQNFPMIHAVGRASDQAPRLLDLRWGPKDAPKVTLVGKGVCFDTGGLNLKPGSSMALMKKDMGGAATQMGLAQAIMELELPISLRLLVPAVENSVSAGAFRPGDVLTSRKGLTVEVNNTDAEGRLVLADALSLADEENPDLMICMATLTGAARVALGPDLAPFYTDDDALAGDLAIAAADVADPLWRMPFWEPYETMIEPDIADLDNAPSGGFAGSITAALFLRRFVSKSTRFAHFDIYGWNPTAAPARPKGGAFLAARALLEALQNGKIL